MIMKSKEDKGAMVFKFLKTKKTNISWVSRELGMTKPTLYKHFADPNMSYELIVRIGYIIQYDFTELFPDLNESLPPYMINPMENYLRHSPTKGQILYLKK